MGNKPQIWQTLQVRYNKNWLYIVLSCGMPDLWQCYYDHFHFWKQGCVVVMCTDDWFGSSALFGETESCTSVTWAQYRVTAWTSDFSLDLYATQCSASSLNSDAFRDDLEYVLYLRSLYVGLIPIKMAMFWLYSQASAVVMDLKPQTCKIMVLYCTTWTNWNQHVANYIVHSTPAWLYPSSWFPLAWYELIKKMKYYVSLSLPKPAWDRFGIITRDQCMINIFHLFIHLCLTQYCGLKNMHFVSQSLYMIVSVVLQLLICTFE